MDYKSLRGFPSFTVCALSLVSVVGCGGGGGGVGSSAAIPSGISKDALALTPETQKTPETPESPAMAFRLVAVPQYDWSYDTISPQVIESQAEMERFLDLPINAARFGPDGFSHRLSWRDNVAFRKALQEADINFETEALVLLPYAYTYTVNSGGTKVTRVTLDTPVIQGTALVSTLRATIFRGGTATVTPQGFALAVSKAAIKEVRVAVAVVGEGEDADAGINAPPSSINLSVRE